MTLTGCWDCYMYARPLMWASFSGYVLPPCQNLRHKRPLTDTGPGDDEALAIAAATSLAPPFAKQTIPFLDLPAELRNKIHELALPLPDKAAPLTVSAPRTDRFMARATQPPLTQTCRQVRAECLPMFYEQANFAAYIHPVDFQPLLDFVECITSGPVKPKITISVKPLARFECIQDLDNALRHWYALDHSTVRLRLSGSCMDVRPCIDRVTFNPVQHIFARWPAKQQLEVIAEAFRGVEEAKSQGMDVEQWLGDDFVRLWRKYGAGCKCRLQGSGNLACSGGVS